MRKLNRSATEVIKDMVQEGESLLNEQKGMFFKGGQGMSIITREEIEDLFETLHPKLDLSTIITVNDEELTKVLHCFLFLKQYEQDIVDHSLFSEKIHCTYHV